MYAIPHRRVLNYYNLYGRPLAGHLHRYKTYILGILAEDELEGG